MLCFFNLKVDQAVLAVQKNSAIFLKYPKYVLCTTLTIVAQVWTFLRFNT